MAPHPHLASYGRGGAGNIADSSKASVLDPKDLETPVLKTPIVTTGRGGTGNMARNVDPAETRARQDVEPVIRRESQGATHVGRGGNGNVFIPGSEDHLNAVKAYAVGASAVSDLSEDKGGVHRSGADKEEHIQPSHAQSQSPSPPPPAASHHHHEHEKSLAARGKEWLMGKRAS